MIDLNTAVSQIVRSDYRTADVFKKHGINYCCGGNASLREACDLKKLSATQIAIELEDAVQSISLPASVRFDEWPLDFLIDYILHVHHTHVKKTTGPLQGMIRNFAEAHKAKYPHMLRVADAFENFADVLLEHMQKEEASIFPYVRQVLSMHSRKDSFASLFVRTLAKPLEQVAEMEHRRIAAYLKELRELTGHYSYTPSVCTNHQVIYHKLKEFDADMVQHKHLENNILFPKVILMERELLHL